MKIPPRIRLWFVRLNQREKVTLALGALGVSLFFLFSIYTYLQEQINDTERLAVIRTRQLDEISELSKRYTSLQQKFAKVQQTFSESQMTFEQVTDQLDSVIKESIGGDDYELKRGRSLEKIGLDYEKQDFTLRVKSLTLDQVVKLLHKLENGKSPLFLGKVDLLKSTRDSRLALTLEIFSIRPNQTPA